ncbi:hypothetical protein BT69DRAFT_1282777 [Atractiella rhizophila]|nr:hypothetical protein BT69DRAFT_1291390 [Atractiella rhizophila]KAH8921942.1 hypothetical protein BT69DRAFT_1282717 [Atractiella rhizophila]KAH8921968.1 hypothetical protein BT69DRAFT_1282777 [Atractiella rhizophila]
MSNEVRLVSISSQERKHTVTYPDSDCSMRIPQHYLPNFRRTIPPIRLGPFLLPCSHQR